ncbi:AGAMOUS-like 53 [Raphanus sativus]|uniref:Agamous-like MADS-box protein AGL93 n=1 Tax=Raphanus sativus TaxID=3726 RepID=A0A6J0K673_RAPSA|nr:agamous-like MADS-box protein AGL93 [Raphanus sativus]KAJ4884024.1 AGAMOUS-like 53 [Raphanus sativus]
MTTTTTRKICRSKLSVRKDTFFKARAKTVLKKAYELSELCGVDLCVICYDREGNLVNTWPENDEARVKATAERFSRLSEKERNKKSTNLSRFLNKKMMDEKKASLKANDNKFSKKVFIFEDSLRSRLGLFQEKITELVDDLGSDDPSLINADQCQPILMNHLSTTESPADLPTSSLNHPSNFSILLYNHDNGTFTQLANSSALPPSFEQPVIPCNQDYGTNYLDLLLGEQDNKFDLPIAPHPMMHTQTSMFHQQFDHQFMQTQEGMIPYNHTQSSSGYPTMMFS